MESASIHLSTLQLQSQVALSFGKMNGGEYDSEYVLHIEEVCDGISCAVSLSDGSFRIYSLSAGQDLVMTASQKTESPIQTIKCSAQSPSIVYTGHCDGTINLWDVRAGAATKSSLFLKLPSDSDLNDIDVSREDNLLAAAAGNSVCFYDIRRSLGLSQREKVPPLGLYSDCHSDIVTQLRFNKMRPAVLTSAGEDGLLCTYDTASAANTNAVVSILNTECPVRNFFYFGQDMTGICCMSTIETLACWHYPSSQRICDYPDIRTTYSIDYLVDGWYDIASDSLIVIGGDYSGNASILGVSPSGVSVEGYLKGGHMASVRCCKRLAVPEKDIFALITGAEDARLSKWGNSSNTPKAVGHARPIKSSSRAIELNSSSHPY